MDFSIECCHLNFVDGSSMKTADFSRTFSVDFICLVSQRKNPNQNVKHHIVTLMI